MRRLPFFVWGHVLGALLVGVVCGAFLDVVAVMTFGGVLMASSVASALVCWWWPGFAGAAWKLWLAGVFGNPLMLVALFFTATDWECLVGQRTGWNCMFSDLGPLVAGVCLLPPICGLIVRALATRRAGT